MAANTKVEQKTQRDGAETSTANSQAAGGNAVTVDAAVTDQSSRALLLQERAVEERFLRRAEANVHIRERMVADSQKQVDQSGWIDTYSGTKAVLEKDVLNEKRQLKLELAKVEEIHAALDRAEALRVEAEAARKRGDSKEADRAIGEAQKILGGISGKIDTKEYRASLTQQTQDLEKSEAKLQTTMTVTKMVRDGAVVVGATIATGGAFTAAAAGGATVFVAGGTAVAVGTATGTGIGLVSNTAGAVEEGINGDKSVKELAKQVLRETGKDAVTSFVASASTAATMGVGSGLGNVKVVQTLTSGLGQTGSKVASGIISGSITGAANGTFTVTAQTAVRFTQAKLAFNQMATENHWTGAERDAKYSEYLESQGLTAKQLLKTGGIQILASAAGGAVGGGSAVAQQTLKTATSKVLATGAGVVADGAIGVGAAALQGDMSNARLAEIIGATVVGHAVGYMAQKAELSSQPKLEKGIDLLTEKCGKAAAEEFRDEIGKMVCKERGLAPTPENIKIARDLRLSQAGEEGALRSIDSLASQVEKSGRTALTTANVEKTCETEMAKVTEKLCRDYKLDKIVDKHTTEMLHEVAGSSSKKLAAKFEEMGLAPSEALQTAKLVKGAVKSGRYDIDIKQKLEDKITDLVSTDLKQGMEASFKQTFRAGLSGESQAPEAQRLQKAMKDQKITLKEDEINELTEAGWRGAQRGIERGVRTVVREGIDAAFDRFRKRGSADDSTRAEELPKLQIREVAADPRAAREGGADPLKAAKEMEAAGAEPVLQQVDEVTLAGQRYERILMREKNGNWHQVGLHLIS